MRIAGTLRVVGYFLCLVVGLPVALDRDAHLADRGMGTWLAAYFVFCIAFHFGASARAHDRQPRLFALGLMTLAMLAMAAILPCQFGSLALVIVASQAALVLELRQTAWLIVGQSVVLGYFLGCSENLQESIGTMIALIAGECFAAVSVYSARREAEARNALTRANAELRSTRALLEETSRVNERTRIARELHDVLGHDLTALGLQLEVARHQPPERSAAHVAKAQAVSARLLGNVRQVVSAMRAAPAPDLGSALRTLVEEVPGLRVHLSMPEFLRIDDGARGHCLLRCVQEIVTNALRHARAGNLWITIAESDGAISVEAHDDGCGAQEVRAGHGLAGMRARLEEIGGSLRVATAPSRAFAVSAWLPGKAGPS